MFLSLEQFTVRITIFNTPNAKFIDVLLYRNYVYNNPSFCQNRKHSLHDATPPWYLSSLRGRDSSGGTNAFGIRKELSLGLLAASSASASHNRALVHRSRALLDGGKQYGCNFYYNEYEKVPSTIEGIKARLGKRKHVTNIEFWYVLTPWGMMSMIC
jgi:hypothetical protein